MVYYYIIYIYVCGYVYTNTTDRYIEYVYNIYAYVYFNDLVI